jgi:ABC-2 type transport system permease protein
MSKPFISTSDSPKNALAGYGKYLCFTIKHNLVRYLVWITVVVFLIAYVGVYYKSMFTTQAKLDEYATIGSSPGMVALVGKISNLATIGGAVWTKIWMFTALTLGIGMVFQVTKGARADEENGRTEIFRSRPFGIHSTLACVVSGALLLCMVIGILSAFACMGLELDPPGTGVPAARGDPAVGVPDLAVPEVVGDVAAVAATVGDAPAVAAADGDAAAVAMAMVGEAAADGVLAVDRVAVDATGAVVAVTGLDGFWVHEVRANAAASRIPSL